MAKVTRRQFLKGLGGFTTLACMGALMPRMLYAQAIGAGKNIVLVNLNGGFDGLGVFPFYSGEVSDIVNNELRPNIHSLPADILKPAFSGSNLRGLHPSFSRLFNETLGNQFMIQQIGIPIYPGGSHNTCQQIYSIGEQNSIGGGKAGWLGRVMDQADLETFQVYGLGVGNKIDFKTSGETPLVLSSLSSYNHSNRNFGGLSFRNANNSNVHSNSTEDSNYARDISRQINALHNLESTAKQALVGAYQTVENSISFVSSIQGYTVAGDYGNGPGVNGPSSFTRRCQDCARVLGFTATDPDLGNKAKIVYLERGGWDTHSNQVASFNNNINDLSNGLTGLVQDLKNAGIWNDTVVYVFSEFGRTNKENGGLGTDHAYANSHLALGGSVNNTLFGTDPDTNELRNANRLSVTIDFRRPIIEMLNWAGINTNGVFNETHDSTSVGIFV